MNKMKLPKILYHGTCKAFVIYAWENEGKFGSDCYNLCFTSNFDYAKMFAQEYKTAIGRKKLDEMFESVPFEFFYEPVILEFDSNKFNQLKIGDDCGNIEYYLDKGPVDINLAKIIQNWTI
jgi:hypothetical protein